MIEFRTVQPEVDRAFVREMFAAQAFESATDAEKRPGSINFRRGWESSPAARAQVQAFERSLRDERTIAAIVRVDGEDAGFVWATFGNDPGEPPYVLLRSVAFRLHYQRRGLGRIAVAHVESLAMEHGATAIRSSGNGRSEGVRRFHESLGFEPVQTIFSKPLSPQ